MSAPAGDYLAPLPFRNPHAATIYAARIARAPRVAYRRARWDTPDGDFIDVDFVEGPKAAPCVVFFHGLEGSSSSSYVRALMAEVHARNWRGVVPHFRGCSGELNRKPRAYHSGDSAEIDWILRRVVREGGGGPVFAVGVSLGGNVLAKWLGEQGSTALPFVARAASICAPVDLTAAGNALEHGFARVYTWAFLRTLKRISRERLSQHPGLFDAQKLEAAMTLRAFDDAVTAPMHGFRDVQDYWTRASCKPHLRGVAVPLLLLNPLDDPFLPARALPRADEVSAQVTREYPSHGGHVGFVDARGGLRWLAERTLRFFDQH